MIKIWYIETEYPMLSNNWPLTLAQLKNNINKSTYPSRRQHRIVPGNHSADWGYTRYRSHVKLAGRSWEGGVLLVHCGWGASIWGSVAFRWKSLILDWLEWFDRVNKSFNQYDPWICIKLSSSIEIFVMYWKDWTNEVKHQFSFRLIWPQSLKPSISTYN